MTHLLLLVAVAIWGSTFVATKICLEHMSTIQLVASRFLIGAPALFVIVRLRHAAFDLKPLARPLTWGAVIFSVHFFVQTWALEFTSATHTGWIIATTPLTIAVLAAVFLQESFSRSLWVGIGIASLGIAVLISRGDLANLDWLSSPGDWLALGSTVTWAIYTIVTRDLSRARDPVVIAFAVTAPLGLAGLVLPFVLPGWTELSTLPSDATAALVFLGLFGVALAQWIWQSGVAKLGAAQAGVFLYVEPLVTTAVAVPVLGERFGAVAAVGGALVLLGVFVSQRRVVE